MSILGNLRSNNSQEAQIKNELDKCNTLNEMFAVMNKYYNLDQPISKMLKPTAVMTIMGKFKTIASFLSIKKR